MIDLIVLFIALVSVPAGLMLLVRPIGRAVFFLMGLTFFLGVGLVVELGGPDSPGLIIPFFGLAISVGALLSETIFRISKLMKGRAPTHG